MPGVGFKPQHFADICNRSGSVQWLEVHAENYMGDGGRPIAQLRKLRETFPISCHGVALSIGGVEPLDSEHLNRLAKLVAWLQPASFSEHLAWSTHEGHYFNDLLPLPYTTETVLRVSNHVDEVQNHLEMRMLLENPSTYLCFKESELDEVDFLGEIARRTGCGLLLDVNNVFVSSANQGLDPYGYIDSFPLELVGEIHLGGHERESLDGGEELLIDNHAAAVDDPVWELYSYTIAKAGPLPTLIEWDNDVPDWDTLEAEARIAARYLAGSSSLAA